MKKQHNRCTVSSKLFNQEQSVCVVIERRNGNVVTLSRTTDNLDEQELMSAQRFKDKSRRNLKLLK